MMKKRLKQLPDWLQDIQHNSWQIEILIAGGLIFTLLQVPDILKDFYIYSLQTSDTSNLRVIFIVSGILISRTLLIGFLLNLLLRAVWLAFLGINFTFPEDINYERLGYSEHFKTQFEQKKNSIERIIRLEQMSTLSYSLALILSLMSLGLFGFLMLAFTLLPERILDVTGLPYLIILLCLAVLMGAFDQLFFHVLRARPKVSSFYYQVHRIFSTLSLGFLYQREWLILLSNIKRWKMHGLLVVYFLLALTITVNDMSKLPYISQDIFPRLFNVDEREYTNVPTSRIIDYTEYADKLRPNQYIMTACINTDIIKHNHLSLFIVQRRYMDASLRYWFERYNVLTSKEAYLNASEVNRIKNDSLYQAALNQQFLVLLDQDTLRELKWFEHKHPQTKEYGFISYLTVDTLAIGQHDLNIRRRTLKDERLKIVGFDQITFWKD